MPLASGATFAGYTVVRMLSSSATGELYLAQQSGLPGWRALKVLPFSLWADSAFRARFHRESQIAVTMYHPNVVEVHERGEFDGQLWIAMDYVDGTDVAQLMVNRFPAVLPVAEVLAIVAAAAGGLDFAHQRGLLHRDVRPGNIVVTTPGAGEPRVLLSDFGLVRPADENAYAAPEELAGATSDGRTDQYALAVTAMHLFTGAPSAVGGDSLGDLRPDLAGLDEPLSRALATDPSDRFGSCREFAGALSERAGLADRGPDLVEQPLVSMVPAYVVDYPAYVWPETAAAAEQTADAAERTVRQPDPKTIRHRGGMRRMLIGAAATVVLIGLFAAGITIGRRTNALAPQAISPAPSISANPTTGSGAPLPFEGTYRIEVQRSKQTFDNTPTPQPPDVETWWAIRSSCTPGRCLAAATLLNDADHTRQKSPGVPPLILEFADGQWHSVPETTKFPCVGPKGVVGSQTTTQVVTLRPQSAGALVGEMAVSVKSNECSQQGAMIRIPAVASRNGDIPPAVNVPDPVGVTPTTTTTAVPPPMPETPTTRPSGPGR